MSRQRGDTIIEVLFAVTVFSVVAVGGLSLMNQGAAMAQRSLEIGLVRDQIDAQADALRYMHNAYVARFDPSDEGVATTELWHKVAQAQAVTEAQNFGEIADGTACRVSSARPFVLNIKKLDTNDASGPVIPITQANADRTETYAQIRYSQDAPPDAQGIWIEAVHAEGQGNTLGYFDFHIRACWSTPGQAAPVTLGTIVRLYDPES